MVTMGESQCGRAAKRVLILVSRRSPHWVAAWDSSEELVTIALNILEEKGFIPSDVGNSHSAIRFLAKERWDVRTFIVFDIFHDTYNPDKAHLAGQDNLPVILAPLARRKWQALRARS
jgi:hypothetical protein